MMISQILFRFTRKSNKLSVLSIITIVGTMIPCCLAAEPAIRIQPDHLSIGQVRVGARVEASILVGREDVDNTVEDIDVKLPSFITLQEVFLDFHGFWVAILTFDTLKPGEYEDNIEIRLGEDMVEMPVSIDILPQKADLTRVLMVETPFHADATRKGALLQAWVDIVRRAKLDVNYFICSRGDGLIPLEEVLEGVELINFDVILLSCRGLYRAQQADLDKLAQFVEEGGRVIIAANRCLVSSVPKANKLLEQYGLKMINEEPQENVWELDSTHLATHSFTKSITRLRFFRPSPISVIDDLHARIVVSAPPYPECGFIAVAKAGKGEVVAIGQSLWWGWIGREEAMEFDNSLLMQQLITEPCN